LGIYDEFLRRIDKILEVEEEKIEKVLDLWINLKEFLLIIRSSCSEPKLKKVIEEVFTSGSRFEISAAACSEPLKDEWQSIAKIDLRRLRENLLALRKIFEKKREKLEEVLLEAFAKAKLGISPTVVIDDLIESGLLSKSTASYLRLESREIEKWKNPDEIRRIAGLLFQIRRLRDAEERNS